MATGVAGIQEGSGDWSNRLSAQVSAKNVALLSVVCEVDFMVKLLRACVWMPWRKKAMKDASSCDKPREAATRL